MGAAGTVLLALGLLPTLLVSPNRPGAPLARRSSRPHVRAIATENDASTIVRACGRDAAELARRLSKDQLRAECARRSLRVSGTKAELAPRLVAALQAELAPPPTAGGARAAVAADGAAARPPRARPAAAQPVAASAEEAGDGPAASRLADRLAERLADAAGPAPLRAEPAARPPRRREGPAGARCAPPASAPAPAPAASRDGAYFEESGSSGADIELTVLGSGACNPSPARSASALALRVGGSFWLFDVGEGTQVQLQRCMVRPGKIDRIFVTHAHGDHCFGLPGLLCLIARGRAASAPPLEIYGPAGLRAFLRAALGFSGTRMVPRFVIHELHAIPVGSRYNAAAPAAAGGGAALGGLAARPWGGEAWGEQPGGRDVLPASDGSWWLLCDGGAEGVSVRAAPLAHARTACVGFVLSEAGKPGRIQPERALPHLERNRDALREEWGVRDPRALFKRLAAAAGRKRGGVHAAGAPCPRPACSADPAALGEDEALTLPDGTVLAARDVRSAARRGRKVVVLGDCSDCSQVVALGAGCDLLVHEATNAYLPSHGDTGGAGRLERETASHGHSTPQMAGRAARAMGAGTLLLNHFSQRYHPESRGVMSMIARLAAREARLADERVIAAFDSMTLPIWQPDRGRPIAPYVASDADHPHDRGP